MPGVVLAQAGEGGSEASTAVGADAHNMVFDLMQVEALDWLRALLILVGAIVVAQILKWSVRRWLHKGNCEVGVADLIARFIGYAMVIVGIVYALMALHVQVGPLLGALGVGGLAIALASKSLLEDLFGGFVLQARHPFHRGDEISVGKHEGVVEDINLRTVVIRTHDGERLFIPSSTVLDEPIVNLTANGARRSTLTFFVPFEADITSTTAAMTKAVQSAEGVHESPPVLSHVKTVGEAGVEVSVKFWHDPGAAETHAAIDAAAGAAIKALAEKGVRHEVPQRRLIDHRGPRVEDE